MYELFEVRKEYLDCDLTQTEIIEKGEVAAKAEATIGLLENEFESVKKTHKNAVTAQELIRSENLAKVARKKESREVCVEVFADWDANLMHYMRKDTGEIYRSRPITPDERQVALFNEQQRDRQVAANKAAIEIHKAEFGVSAASEREDG